MKTIAAFTALLFIFWTPAKFHAQGCIDSTLINPDAICPAIYAPICGCDGVTYENDCVAMNLGGVTSWTDGPCSGGSGCMDMSGLDFGMCDMFLGFGWNGSGCSSMSGCGYVIGSVDYTPNFYSTIEECEAICGSDCMDLSGVDFGLCDMALGIGLIGSSCVSISGCDYTVGDIDYSPYFFTSMNDCMAACGDETGCISQWQLNQGIDMMCPFIYDPVCGCNNVTYGNSCEAYYYGGVTTYGAGACSESTCLGIPQYIDFGDCAMPLGWAFTSNGCVEMSGCSYIGQNGYDYASLFFASSYQCGNYCVDSVVVSCVDSTLIDPNVACIALYNPVCGCNNVTYSNSCIAMYTGGVTSWTLGECGTLVNSISSLNFEMYPNPASTWVSISLSQTGNAELRIFDLSGSMIQTQILANGRGTIDLTVLSEGIYVIEIKDAGGSVGRQRLIKLN